MKRIILLLLLFHGIIIQSQNILISRNVDDRYGPNEPSIIINPNNPNILVAGSILNNFHHSNDGGRTWEIGELTSSYGVWGDPVIDVDSKGNFYYFHLSNVSEGDGWLDRIVCQKSTDNGVSWSDGSYTGLNGSKDQDKQWSVIDRSNDNIYLTWTQFDEYGSKDPTCASVILFSKSLDGGESWSNPLQINKFVGDCLDGDDAVGGAVPAVGPNGEIYVTWAGPRGLMFNRSLDKGESWLQEEILIDTMPGGWNQNISGISRANGFPITKCDLSGGPNHGTIYVNWSDQRNGEHDTDIWFSKSTDGGNTWSSKSKVNNDNSNRQQFFTWMDIDQTNGNLHFVFYDRRNHSGDQTDVYLAFSNNGGRSFKNKRISESPFLPNKGVFFGDYTNITVHNNIVRPIWTRLHEGELSIWTDVTSFNGTPSTYKNFNSKKIETVKLYPNPMVDKKSYISFKLRKSSIVNLEVFDGSGNMILNILDHVEMRSGKYSIPIELTELNLRSGRYYCKLSINGESKTLKTIIIK
jgi:hypothetical protein